MFYRVRRRAIYGCDSAEVPSIAKQLRREGKYV